MKEKEQEEQRKLLEEAATVILHLDQVDKIRASSKKIRDTFKDLNNRDYSHLEEANWWD